MNSKKVLLSLMLAGVIAVSATGCAVVQPGEVGIKSSLGSIKNEPLTSGLHFAFPIVDRVNTFDTRTVALPEEFNKTLTKDAQSVQVTGTTTYSINGAKAVEIFTKIGTDTEAVKNKEIIPVLLAVVKDVTSQYTMQEIYENQPKIAAQITQGVKQRLSSNDYVNLIDFSITGFVLDPEVQKAIESRQIANQKLQQKQTEIEIAKKEAERLEILNKAITDKTLAQEAVSKWNGNSAVFSPNGLGSTPVIVQSNK